MERKGLGWGGWPTLPARTPLCAQDSPSQVPAGRCPNPELLGEGVGHDAHRSSISDRGLARKPGLCRGLDTAGTGVHAALVLTLDQAAPPPWAPSAAPRRGGMLHPRDLHAHSQFPAWTLPPGSSWGVEVEEVN